MKTILSLIMIVMSCLSAITGFAQKEPVPIPSTKLTVANGLPQSFVSGLVQDKAGFIWIATRDGLARYDGKTCKNFVHIPGNKKTLFNNVISSLYLDSHQFLWICYDQGSIDILNTQTEALFHFTEDPLYHAIAGNYAVGKAIVEDGQGKIWIRQSRGAGFYVCDLLKRNLQNIPAQQLHYQQVLGLYINNGSYYFIGDTAMTVTGRDKKQVVVRYAFEHPQLSSVKRPWKDLTPIIRQQSGELVSVDEERLIIYKPSSGKFTTIALPHRELYMLPCITQDDSGNIFLGYNKSVFLLDRQNKLHLWHNDDSVYKEPVCMLYDRSGMLWIGSNATGVQGYDLRLSQVTSYAYRDNFVRDLFLSVLKTSEADFKKSFLYATKPYMFRWTVDNHGNYWLSNGANDLTPSPQLLHFKNNRLSAGAWHYVNGGLKEHKRISAMAVSNAGKLWGVDYDFRLVRFEPLNGSVTVFPPVIKDSMITQNLITGMIMEGEDTCWIATMYHGLIRYVISSGDTKRLMRDDRQVLAEITSVAEDKNDPRYLWLGTLGGGLIRYEKATNRYITLTTQNGLPNNTIYALVQDKKGRLWCSTNRGIFSFNMQTFSVENVQDLKDALSGEEFNRFHFFSMPDGSIMFGGIKGYVVFDPEKIVADSFAPQVALTGISVNNEAADLTSDKPMFAQAINSLEKIELPYNKNFLSFEFAALEFNMPEKLRYRYMLEGLDDKWIDAGTRNNAFYTNIPPGHYTLKVIASNTAGIWASHTKELQVIIDPPFWKTWWFICCCIFLLAMLLLLFIRWQIRTIREKAQTKLRYERDVLELEAQALRAQMNPHFTFNCLNSIKALIQEDNSRQAVRYLTSFSRLIRSQMNNARREVTLYEELESCRLYIEMESLRFEGRIHCTIFVDDDIDTHSLIVPPLIIQPFIENAIWHGVLPKEENGTISVRVTKESDQVVCIIEDDGIGRSAAAARKSHTSPHQSQGMLLVKSRLDLHDLLYHSGGTLSITDKTDEQGNPAGTIVCLRFKTELL